MAPPATSRKEFLASHVQIESDQDGECAICYEPYSARHPKVCNSECSHTFGLSCLDYWLKRSDNCPMCRKQFFNKINPRRVIENIVRDIVHRALTDRSLHFCPTYYTISELYRRRVVFTYGNGIQALFWLRVARRLGVARYDLDDHDAQPLTMQALPEVWNGPGLYPPAAVAQWYNPRLNLDSLVWVDWVLRDEPWVPPLHGWFNFPEIAKVFWVTVTLAHDTWLAFLGIVLGLLIPFAVARHWH